MLAIAMDTEVRAVAVALGRTVPLISIPGEGIGVWGATVLEASAGGAVAVLSPSGRYVGVGKTSSGGEGFGEGSEVGCANRVDERDELKLLLDECEVDPEEAHTSFCAPM